MITYIKFKQILIILITCIIIVMAACTGHHDDDTSVKPQPEETVLDIPDSLITTQCMLLINPTNNDLDRYGRAGTMLAMHARLNSLGVSMPVRIIMDEEEMTGLRKRLLRIGRLDSLVTVLPQTTSERIKSKLRTRHPITVLIDSLRRVVMSGDISSPSYKQRIYDRYLSKEKAFLQIKDTVVRISENPDTFMYLKNASSHPLVIYEVESSCDCSKVRPESNIIAPYDSTRLYLTHTGNNHAKTLTNILIYSNHKNGIREVKIDSSRKYRNHPNE